ncbi:hypothetical protein ABW636_22360 [Aquimarina sp. 2201CG1-2-11]|uniref:hypothetical protein n=1 Tax=Aquimarina discodermiae TaxID=3231043 RepID=UPI003462AE7C
MNKTAFEFVNSSAKKILDLINRQAIKNLMMEPVEGEMLKEVIARLCRIASPSYLPIARDSDGILAIHLWPGREIEVSPLVYIYNSDSYSPEFVCDQLASLPRAMWLRSAAYFTTEIEELKDTMNLMYAEIPSAKKVPEHFWDQIDESFSRWSYANIVSRSLWEEANLEHHLTGIPIIDSLVEPEEALKTIESYVNNQSYVSKEVLSIFIGTQAKNKIAVSKENVLKVLEKEAWHSFDNQVRGYWKINGEGISTYDTVMKSIGDDFEEILGDTMFKPLIETPDVYTGQNPKGFIKLLKVAVECKKQKDYEMYLKQLRNTTVVSIMSMSSYDDALADLNIDACKLVNPDSLATALAIVSKDVKELGA